MGAAILSNLIGAAISLLGTWLFYLRAGSELRTEAANLRKLVKLVLGSLEHAGIATLVYDSTGEPTSFVIKLSGTMRGPTATLNGESTVTPKPPDPA